MPKYLSGTHGYLLVDGMLFGEVQEYESKITVERDEIQEGLGFDSIINGLKGEGTFSYIQKGTRGLNRYLELLKQGIDPRLNLVSGLKSPAAYKKQSENIIIPGVWLNEIPLQKWKKGEKVQKDISFGFTATKAQYEDAIELD